MRAAHAIEWTLKGLKKPPFIKEKAALAWQWVPEPKREGVSIVGRATKTR